MERLTFKLGSSYGLEDKASSSVGLFTDYDGFFAYYKAVNALGKYEDVGLYPEEVEQLQKENTELKANQPIRCGECKYFATEKSTGINWCRLSKGLDGALTADMYCCRAEEKEVEQYGK